MRIDEEMIKLIDAQNGVREDGCLVKCVGFLLVVAPFIDPVDSRDQVITCKRI